MLLQALFGQQGNLASYPNYEVLQIFPKGEAKGPPASPAPPMPPGGRAVRKGLKSQYIQGLQPGSQATG